jgi:hypothetical protein
MASASLGNSKSSPLMDEVLLDEEYLEEEDEFIEVVEEEVEEEEYDEHEVLELNLEDSPRKPSSTRNRLVNQAALDQYDDNDDDTLSNVSDSEFTK